MTRSKILLSLGAFALLTLAGCAAADRPTSSAPQETESRRIASIDIVKPDVQPAEITAGGVTETTVRLAIQSGYHVNANPPSFSYLIPTELKITPSDGISVGALSYPKPINAKFSFSEQPLAVYEGNIEIKVALKADKSSKPGQHSLAAKLLVQACDDQVCYPPGTRDLAIPLIIKMIIE